MDAVPTVRSRIGATPINEPMCWRRIASPKKPAGTARRWRSNSRSRRLGFDVEVTGFESAEVDLILEEADEPHGPTPGPEDDIRFSLRRRFRIR